jgi:hypothetical protein
MSSLLLPMLTLSDVAALQIVYCCWLCFELAYVWAFVVETRGLSLEETAALFDGEQAEENVLAAGTHAHAAGVSEGEIREDVYEKEATV